MNSRNSICRLTKHHYAELLLHADAAPEAARQHVAECEACRAELRSLEATMALLNEWEAPEPTGWFDSRLSARLREERQAVPAGFFERLRERLLFGSNMHLQPVAAGALALLLMIGGGTYVSLVSAHHPAAAVPSSATVRDLQSLDENAQVFQQLNDLDAGDTGSEAAPAGSNL